MGGIVFSTIRDNIKSFFGREDELLANPRAVPEPASEVFERPSAAPPQRIVDKPLPQRPQLPFTPDELRAAVRAPPAPAPTPAPEPVHREIMPDIEDFESTLHSVHTTIEIPQPRAVPTQPPPPLEDPTPEGNGFFSEFEQYLLKGDLDADGLLDRDVLSHMKEFHRHQREGKEYYIYSKDIREAVKRKLTELKTLEKEWFHTRTEMDELEQGLRTVEREIETRTLEVKALLHQAKTKSRLERTVAAGREFVLSDGRKLASLLDLKIALRTIPDEVFHHHVTSWKNDFAAWVRGVMNDAELADQMAVIRDRHQLDTFLSTLSG